jgi:hypothetical protein
VWRKRETLVPGPDIQEERFRKKYFGELTLTMSDGPRGKGAVRVFHYVVGPGTNF